MTKILIVDDQADLRRLVRWALELIELPVELHEANTGTAALQALQQLRPKLVLLDVMLPGGVDGLQICRAIKKSPDLQQTKVILLSARGQQTDVQAGLDAGADAYMVKPFSPQRLLEAVEEQLASLASSSH